MHIFAATMAASGGRSCILPTNLIIMIFLCVSGIAVAARPTRQLQNSSQKVNKKYRNLVTYPEVNLTSDGYKLLCYDVSQVASPTFPSMAFQFTDAEGTANVDFSLAGENVFIAVDNLGYHQCLAFDVGSSPSIIGNIAMGDHLMKHDLVNKEIGWKQEVC